MFKKLKTLFSTLAGFLLLATSAFSLGVGGGDGGGVSGNEWFQSSSTALNVTSPLITTLCNQDGSACGTFASLAGMVSSALNITDNAITRGDGGAKGIQESGILIDDSDNVTGIAGLEMDGQLDTDATIAAGASAGHLIKSTLGAGETYTGTTAGLTVKNYDADATVDHDGGENSGLAIFYKQLSAMASGGESSIATLHTHSSTDQKLTNGLVMYPKSAGSAFAVRDATVDYGFDLADASNVSVTAGDIRGHEGEVIFNNPDGTWNFGNANLATTGSISDGTATVSAGVGTGFSSITSTAFVGELTGNASTSTALVANGADCISGNSPLGVDASGAVESCFDVWTEAENTSAAYIDNSVATLSSLTSVGTIGTGTWQATDVGVAHGGTGKSSWTQYLIPYASSTTAFSQIPIGTDGQVLTSGGAGEAPSFQDVAAGADADKVFFIPAGGASNVDGIAESQAYSVGVLRMPDASDTSIRFAHKVPDVSQTISSIKVLIYNATGTSNIYVRTVSGFVDWGSMPIAGSEDSTDSLTATAVGATAGRWEAITLPAGSYDAHSLAAGDVLSIRFQRQSSDAADTYNAILDVAGLIITYS